MSVLDTPAEGRGVVVLLVGDPAPTVLDDWSVAARGGEVWAAGCPDELRSVLSGLDDDQLVVVAEAATTPGPEVVGRLLAARDTADVVDARTLPLDLSVAPEADMDAELIAVRIGKVGPRVSGTCVLTTTSVAVAVVDVLGSARDQTTGRLLLEAAGAAGHSVGVALDATVVRHAKLLAESPGTEEGSLSDGPRPVAATPIEHVLRSTGVLTDATGPAPHEGPFLTVLTRTQGRRRRCLEDVLACLAAQEDRDFEWIVACHRADAGELALVHEVVSGAPPWLTQRVRVIEVDRTGRSAPLNEGLAAAAGRYVAILDDDDTVSSAWVATFRELELAGAGRVLRAVAVRQSVVPFETEGGTVALTVGNPRRDWPDDFDLLDHLAHNETPLMSVAFPRALFHRWGLAFDEGLDITEDWDFVVRAVGLVGVACTPLPTAVYRWWLGVETSRAVHDEAEWDAARLRVLDGFARSYVLLPGDGARRLQSELAAAHARIADLEASQHDVIVQLDRTASEHQKTVDNWRATEARVDELKDRLVTLRARTSRRLDLIREIEELLDLPGMQRPTANIYEMGPNDLERTLARLVDASQHPAGRPRRAWWSR